MSELMFLLGETDPRVRVLMTTIKQWARSCDVTRSNPGPWPANFTLLSMLIFFLQTCSPAVLPSLRQLQTLAGQWTQSQSPGFNLIFFNFIHFFLSLSGKFGPPYLGKATTAARAVLPSPTSACWVFTCFRNPPHSDMDYRIFNMRT